MSLKAAIYAGCSKVAARRKGVGFGVVFKASLSWRTVEDQKPRANGGFLFSYVSASVSASDSFFKLCELCVLCGKSFWVGFAFASSSQERVAAPVYAACSNVAAVCFQGWVLISGFL